MTGAKTNEIEGTRSQIRQIRFSASKARLVLNLVRGKSLAQASEILAFSERGAAMPIAKCLQAAVANAVTNDGLNPAELYVSACYADEGPTMKRFRPRARGRAGAIHKQTCHITVIVSQMEASALEVQQAKASKSSGSPSTGDRSARVAKSRGEDVVEETPEADETIEATEAVAVEEAATVEEAAEVSEAVSETVDSDDDGTVNAADESPYGDGSHAAFDDDSMPEGFPIKGNAQSKLYHNLASPFYKRTKAEVWFANEKAAEAAGFSKPASQQAKEDAANGEDA